MESAETATGSPRSSENRDRRQRIGVYAAALTIAFLAGLVPMWMTARGYAQERDRIRHELFSSRLENGLARAAILARRGQYEPAREAASRFYDETRQALDGNGDVLDPSQREALRTLISNRDDIITLLARSDPSSAERLAEFYLSSHQVLHPEDGSGTAIAVPVPPSR